MLRLFAAVQSRWCLPQDCPSSGIQYSIPGTLSLATYHASHKKTAKAVLLVYSSFLQIQTAMTSNQWKKEERYNGWVKRNNLRDRDSPWTPKKIGYVLKDCSVIFCALQTNRIISWKMELWKGINALRERERAASQYFPLFWGERGAI